MADESISSSPIKLNRSIHRSRLHRKTQRLNATFTRSAEPSCSSANVLPSNNGRTPNVDQSCTLLVMYDTEECTEEIIKVESTHSCSEKPRFKVDTNFDPFAEQRLLVLADRFGAPLPSSTRFVATQGFEPSDAFLIQSAIEKNTLFKNSINETFEITDSELLQVCEDTEKNTASNNNKQENCNDHELSATPESKPKTKSIVDLILEDFCSSPASPEPQQSSEESSFHFRFANKPLRTYSRGRHENTFARLNIAEKYGQTAESETHCALEDDDLLSNDSSTDLSVQEDLTQLNPTTNAEQVDLQHSQNLCENLQNLSAYFSELSDKNQEMCLVALPQALAQNNTENSVLLAAKRTSGIQNPAINGKTYASQLKEELEELHNTQQQCSTRRELHISSEEDFKGFQSEDEDDQHCDIVPARGKEEDDDEWNDECDFFANFDMEVALDAASTSKVCKKDSLEVINEFNLNDSEGIADSTAGFRTASNKIVMISAEAKACAFKLLQELPPLPTNTSYTDDLIMNDDEIEEVQHVLNCTMTISKHANEHLMNNPTNLTQEDLLENRTKLSQRDAMENSNPQIKLIDKPTKQYLMGITSNLPQEGLIKKTTHLPQEELKVNRCNVRTNLDCKPVAEDWVEILSNLPQQDLTENSLNIPQPNLIENLSNLTTNLDDKLTRKFSQEALTNIGDRSSNFQNEINGMPNFVGFSTASNGISKEAQHASKIFECLPTSPDKHASIPSDKPSTSVPPNNKPFVGFRTASSKAIKVSKEAQERASKILEQLPELNAVGELETNNNIAMNAAPSAGLYAGFRTASSKSIQISEEAQKRAALIIQDVMEENAGHKPEECLENMQFSEWPVEEEQAHAEQIEVKATNAANEYESNINLAGFSTASKKAILISETARHKAAAILEILTQPPDDAQLESMFKNVESSTKLEPSDNVVFSEWPLAEIVEGSDCGQAAQSNGSNKRKRHGIDFASNDDEPSSPKHTPKLICKSLSIQRSPLAHIQPSVTRSSLSELAVKTPPDYRASRGIIARKNLLSLNKRLKLNAKSLQQCKEFKDECSVPETPTKCNGIAEPKSPPDTPNLRQFFASACMSTSTPHPPKREQAHMRTRARRRAELEADATATPTNDLSLKRIEWDNETLNKSASSLNASRLSNSSCSNITKMESNPTPKQRIERLRMYGKPPNVSPIYMSSTNNCRISGLKRRTRSATKDEP